MATKKISELESMNAADESDVLAIVDVSEGTTKKITKGNLLVGAGHTIEMEIDTNYQLVLKLKNEAGTVLSTQSIDLPNEDALTNISYSNGKLTLTKQSGTTSQVDISGLINGLVTETDFNTFKEELEETIETMQGDIEKNQKKITILEEKVETLESNQELGEGYGIDIYLSDSAKAPFEEFDIIGHSEQDGEPTPESPVDVKSCGENGNVNVKVESKNLLNKEILTHGQLFSNNVINSNQTKMGYSDYIDVSNLTNITISLNSNLGYRLEKIYYYNSSRNEISYELSTSTAKTFTIPSGTKFIRISITTTNWSSSTTFDEAKDDMQIQIEPGTQATSYVPHEEQNISIPVQQPMMDDDYFDRENNEEVHTWQKTVLDGSNDENWSIRNNKFFIMDNVTYSSWIGEMGPQSKSNIGIVNYSVLDDQTGFGLALAYGIRINLSNVDASNGGTVEQLRAYLAENPITVYVKMKKEAYEKLPFTQEQIDAFNEVDEAYSYKGGTYISSPDEVKPQLEVVYVKDPKTVWQNKITPDNKLSSDLVDDTNSTNKFTTTSEKNTWNDKYSKPSAGIPKSDLSNEVKNILDKAENTDNKVIELTEESTNTQYPGAKAVYDKFVDIETEIANIQSSIGHVYGIRRKITNNSSSAWERLFDSIGKTATATKNGGTVQNDFDNLAPWSEIKSCNYDLTTKKINAWFGDANFKFDGTNGDVFTHVPKTYWKIYQEDDYDYVLLANYPKAGFMEVDGFFIGRYNASVVSDVLHSYSGLVPTTNKTIGQFRTLANALGSNFSQLDWRYFVLQMLYLVEYADYNSQSKLGNGVQSRKYLKTLVAESNTNRAIIESASGYYVGQIIRIGTSDGGTQIADARKITAIEAYDEDGVTGVALTFDGAAVNIAVDNFVCTMAQETGQCDSLGMKSGCLNNDGYHSVIYRGVENIFANIYVWVDGINIKDNLAYICKDHSEYASDKFTDPYKPLAYTNASSFGWAKTLGLDVDEPFFRFPTEVGGGSSTYMCDYYYQNTGNSVALVGGTFYTGDSGGLWYWNLFSASSGMFWDIGARVLIDNQ